MANTYEWHHFHLIIKIKKMANTYEWHHFHLLLEIHLKCRPWIQILKNSKLLNYSTSKNNELKKDEITSYKLYMMEKQSHYDCFNLCFNKLTEFILYNSYYNYQFLDISDI